MRPTKRRTRMSAVSTSGLAPRMILFGAAASPHGWRGIRRAQRRAMQLGIRVSRRRAVHELPRAKAHAPDTMNSTSSAREIWPTLHGWIRIEFRVDNDGDKRGVSDPPGRPWGR